MKFIEALLLFFLFIPRVHAHLEAQSAEQVAHCEFLSAIDQNITITPQFDTAVEAELVASKRLFDSLITREERAAEEEWERLSLAEKKAWIDRLAPDLGEEGFFREKRLIQGLRTKADQVPVDLSEDISLFGKVFFKDQKAIDLSSVLQPQVEYRGLRDTVSFRGVELHWRARMTASALVLDTWRLFELLGLPKTALHSHILGKLSDFTVKENPLFTAFRWVELIRRAEVLSHMIGIVEDGLTVYLRRKNKPGYGDIPIYGYLIQDDLRRLSHGLYQPFIYAPIQSALDKKGGWIRFRVKIYDQKGVFGLEATNSRKNSKPGNVKAFLDSLQIAVSNPNSFMNIEEWATLLRALLMEEPSLQSIFPFSLESNDPYYSRPGTKWIREPGNDGFNAMFIDDRERFLHHFFQQAYYIGSFHSTRSTVKMQSALNDLEIPLPKDLFEDPSILSNKHAEIFMLYHNWNFDPVLVGNQPLKDRLTNFQIEALKKIKIDSSNENITRVMRAFLLESGLYEAYLKSMGLKRGAKSN